MYCWCLDDDPAPRLARPRGVPKEFKAAAYHLVYFTMPNHTRLEFVPVLGFTSLEFEHHGTTMGASATLVKFQGQVTDPAASPR